MAHRFEQIIFGARDKTDLAVRHVAEEAGAESWVANMSRKILCFQYVDSTINSCDEFIALSFMRGRPDRRDHGPFKARRSACELFVASREDESELARDPSDLFGRGVDFVLVDHAEEAMRADYALGIPPVVVRCQGSPPFTCPGPPRCDGARSFY